MLKISSSFNRSFRRIFYHSNRNFLFRSCKYPFYQTTRHFSEIGRVSNDIPINERKRNIKRIWKPIQWIVFSFLGAGVALVAGTICLEVYEDECWLSKKFYVWFPSIESLVLAIRDYGFYERYPGIKEAITQQTKEDHQSNSIDIIEETFIREPFMSSKQKGILTPSVKESASRSETSFQEEHSTNKTSNKKSETSQSKPCTDSTCSIVNIEEKSSSENVLLKDSSTSPSVSTSLVSLNQETHPSVRSLIESINAIITAVLALSSTNILKEPLDALKADITALNTVLYQTDIQAKTIIDQKLSEQKVYFEDILKAQETAFKTQLANKETYWMTVLKQEYERLAKTYHERLLGELEKLKELNEKKLKNELIQQAIELQRRWIREMKARVEEQRGRRLGQLEHLYKHVKQLESIFSQAKIFSEGTMYVQRLQIASQALRRIIEDPQQKSFTKELYVLKDLSEQDEFIQTVIHTIKRETHEQGIMSKAQLTDRFHHLANEIYKVSLCPDNTGVLGTGRADSDHVHHILARTETYLEKNNLDAATRELNQLKGVPKKLASDWLKYARQNLEVIQALNMIETYTLLQSILFVSGIKILISLDEEEVEALLNCLEKDIKEDFKIRYNSISRLKSLVTDISCAKIIGSKRGFLILFQLAFSDPTILQKSADAARCIFNTMLLYSDSRDIFIENDGIQHIMKEYTNFLKLPLINEDSFDFMFIYTRILFLLTTQPGKAMTTLMELGIFQVINQYLEYFETYLKSSNVWRKQNISTIQEYMKLLFNLVRGETNESLVNILSLIRLLNLSLSHSNQQLTFEIVNCLLNLPIAEFLNPENCPEYCIEELLKILDTLLLSIDLGVHSNDQSPSVNLDSATETKILSLITFFRKILKHSTEPIETLLAFHLLPQSKDREHILGRGDTLSSRALRAMTVPFPLIRESISWLLYELNHSDGNIGFGYASGFLVSQGIPFTSPDSKDFQATDGINPITGQTLEAERMALSSFPEMTEEEKERDAERLFVMFQRLEKNGVLSVKNPIKDILQSGRFSD
ncbi:hypothetical protein PMAC_000921 [Pneumocystis sp. 'macacae']|nr:hypothetical protein PMAC_000921 [Pneumocystis sp. 'macacae']